MTVDANYLFDRSMDPDRVVNAWRILAGEATLRPDGLLDGTIETRTHNGSLRWAAIETARHLIHYHPHVWHNDTCYQQLSWCNTTDRKVAVFVALAMQFGGIVIPRDVDPDTLEDFGACNWSLNYGKDENYYSFAEMLAGLKEVQPNQIRAAREAWSLRKHTW